MLKYVIKLIQDLLEPVAPLKSVFSWLFLAGPLMKWFYRRREQELEGLDEVKQPELFERTQRAVTSLYDWMLFGGKMISTGRNSTYKLVLTSSIWTFERLKVMRLGGWRKDDGSPCDFQPIQYLLAAISALTVIMSAGVYIVSTYKFISAAGIDQVTMTAVAISSLLMAVLLVPMTLVNVLPGLYLHHLNRDHKRLMGQ